MTKHSPKVGQGSYTERNYIQLGRYLENVMCNSKADLGAGYIINSFIEYSFNLIRKVLIF